MKKFSALILIFIIATLGIMLCACGRAPVETAHNIVNGVCVNCSKSATEIVGEKLAEVGTMSNGTYDLYYEKDDMVSIISYDPAKKEVYLYMSYATSSDTIPLLLLISLDKNANYSYDYLFRFDSYDMSGTIYAPSLSSLEQLSYYSNNFPSSMTSTARSAALAEAKALVSRFEIWLDELDVGFKTSAFGFN